MSAGSPYERAVRDPEFRARFTGAYRGSQQPLDALWWQEHPGETAPSGAVAPAARLATLRRAVYAPGSGSDERERYRRLEQELDREREAVRVALVASGIDGRRQSPTARSAPAAPAGIPVPAERALPAGRSPVRRLALVAALAASAAFVVGVLVAPMLGAGREPAPAPAPSETAPFISGGSGTGSALGIFGEPQRDIDRPAISVDARLLPGSFRRLQALPLRGVDVYAAQDTTGDVCLVALAVSARLTASCAPVPTWRRMPIRMVFRADAYLDDGTRVGDQVELTATWAFLGPFDLEEKAVGE